MFRLAGNPRTWHAEDLGAVLSAGPGPGAAASDATAARLHGWDVPAPAFEVTVPAPRHPRPSGVLVHRNRLLTPASVRAAAGSAATAPARRGTRRRLALADWLVMRYGWQDFEVRLDEAIEEIRRALAR